MEIRELRYFLAVAREENITRAAESLHIAQPSLSKQMMELEKKLGKQLLIRGKRKITLTEDGIILRKRAEEIIGLVDKTEQEMSYDSKVLAGDIYIGGCASDSIVSAAAKVREKYPEIRFYFYNDDAIDVAERLNHGSLDFAVMLDPIDNEKYDFISLNDVSEWGILADKKDSLSNKTTVDKEDIKRLPLIIHQRIGLQNEIAHWAGIASEDLNIAATYNVVHGNPIPFVKHGLGYFLSTKDLLVPLPEREVCFLPLQPKLSTKLSLVWKRHAMFSKAAEVFVDRLKNETMSKEYSI